jgi:hypothetical protein
MKRLKANISIWHIYLPIVILFAAIGTNDRIIHFLWAIGFSLIPILVFLIFLKKQWKPNWVFVKSDLIPKFHQVIMIIFVLFLGSWIPDIDWEFMIHRCPITHSVLPFLLMKGYGYFSKNEWDKRLLIFFGYGLASHLVWDVIPGTGNVVWLPAWLDMPFLLVNGLATFYLSYRLHKNSMKDQYS